MKTETLPAGWKIFVFSQIAESITERVDDPSTAGVDRYVGLEHLDPESTKIRRWGSPEDVESTKLRFYPGDVVYARRRAYQKKLGVADFEGICSAHALVLRARPDACMPEFLPYFLQSDAFHQRALDISVGSLSPTINWKTLAVQEFALPPIDEQQRIVALLSTIDHAIESYEMVIDTAESWIRSYFHQRTSEEPRTRLGDVAAVDLGRQRAPRFDSGPNMLPYIRAANVKPGRLLLDDVLTMHFDQSEVARLKLQSGDVLITEGCGSLAEIGANAVWNDDLPGDVCFQNTVLRLRSFSGLLDPAFLKLWAAQAFVQGEFAEIATGTSIYHLGAKRTAEMRMPLPSVKQQQQIVQTVDAGRSTSKEAHLSADRLRDLRRTHLRQLLDDGGSRVQ